MITNDAGLTIVFLEGMPNVTYAPGRRRILLLVRQYYSCFSKFDKSSFLVDLENTSIEINHQENKSSMIVKWPCLSNAVGSLLY